MKINLNVKIQGGKRTLLQVDVYSTSVNTKTIELPDGRKITEQKIATWIETELIKVLPSLAESKP